MLYFIWVFSSSVLFGCGLWQQLLRKPLNQKRPVQHPQAQTSGPPAPQTPPTESSSPLTWSRRSSLLRLKFLNIYYPVNLLGLSAPTLAGNSGNISLSSVRLAQLQPSCLMTVIEFIKLCIERGKGFCL